MKEYESRKQMLQDLIKPGAVIAEVGVFAGDFADWMVRTLKPSKLYAIDPYISTIGLMGSADEHGFGMTFYELELLHGFVRNLFADHPEVEIRRQTSGDFFKEIPDGTLDAVYIDGDHSAVAVRNDLEAARLAVKEGGWILGHDYDIHPEKGNQQATNMCKEVAREFCEKYNLEVHAVGKDGIYSFAIQNNHKYKFCIVSVSDRPQLYQKTFNYMLEYAKKHNYYFKPHLEVLTKERHAAWSKVLADDLELQKNEFDYVVWMDDDIVLTDLEKPLSYWVDKYNFRKSNAFIMVSSDIPEEPSTVMNTGIMFFKSKPENLKLNQFVWQYGEMSPLLKQQFSWEQEAYNFVYKYLERNHFLIIPLPNFQSFARVQIDMKYVWKPGQFAAHLNLGGLDKKLMMLSLIERAMKKD